MEAPKKIYLVKDENTDKPMDYWYNATTDDSKVEYTRTDAFIEKACEYFEPILTEYAGFYIGTEILEHFKKYMKGE